MKKLCVALSAVLMLVITGTAFAQNATLDVRLGAGSAKDPEKVGFNTTVALGYSVNPYFEIFGKPGLTWFSWDEGLGIMKQAGPGLTSELKMNVDAYCYPVLAGAKIKLADAKESIGIIPYISGAAGYTWMKYKYSIPAYTTPAPTSLSMPAMSDSSTYKGFTFEVIGGFSYKFEGTAMSIAAEGGYRGMKLTKDDYEVNMSGWVANAGVSFALGGSDW